MTAKYANHAKKEASCGSPSRIWRVSRLRLFALCRRPLSDLCAPVVEIPVKQSQFTRRCRAQLYKQTQFSLFRREEACRREQTNPIFADGAWGTPGAVRWTNKAKLGQDGTYGGRVQDTYHAKQSQFSN
jgi:hypothetical protein